MPTCPNGHQSVAEDWCEVCGHRMAGPVASPPPPPPGFPGAPAAPAPQQGGYGFPPPPPGSAPPPGGYGFPPPPGSGQAPGPGTGQAELCPQCGTPREAMAPFCEECRYNFLTHSSTSASYPAPQQQSAPPPGFPPQPGGPDQYEYQGSRPSQMNRPAEPLGPGQQSGPAGPPQPPFGDATPPPYGDAGPPPQPQGPQPQAPSQGGDDWLLPPPGGSQAPGAPQGVPQQSPPGQPGPGQPGPGQAAPGQPGPYGQPGPQGFPPQGPGTQGPGTQGPGPHGPGPQGPFEQPAPPPPPYGQSAPPAPPGPYDSQQSGPYEQQQPFPQQQPPPYDQPGQQGQPGQQQAGTGEQPWPPGGGAPGPAATGAGWVAVIAPDREYFTAMMGRSGPEAAGLNLPAYSPEQQLPLSGQQVTIGRRRHSTGESPDIDLARSPEDPGVSHQHAMLVQQPDGGWAVVDQNSTNGTTINGGEDPIQPYVPIPLQEGDRVHVGAWTTITVRRG
ncbi:FHA domain-containing protein [Streptomyces niger]|uniref:FHA domain-containing protein n=1 Tax=Streptomyces niger TaxID=66373 RepID=UPI00069ABF95|nr:FHA domain-containing protein [Streptomyces niger]